MGLSPESVFIVSLLALAVAVMLTAAVTLRTVAPPALRLQTETAAVAQRGVPVQIICPQTTIPTRVELARRSAPEQGLVVLACAEFDGPPTCHQACLSMPVPLVSA